MLLEDGEKDGNDNAREKDDGNEPPVADVFVRHVEAGEGGTNRPRETRRKKHFMGRGLWDFDAGSPVGLGASGDGGCDVAEDFSGADLSDCFSGGGSFRTGTMGVCFLWI